MTPTRRSSGCVKATSIHPKRVVLADGEPWQNSGDGTGAAQVVKYAAEEVVVAVETSEPAYLVLSDSYYPGWSATLDGEEIPIHKADVAFRAVAVPAGEHQVVFRYLPTHFWVGSGCQYRRLDIMPGAAGDKAMLTGRLKNVVAFPCDGRFFLSALSVPRLTGV